MAFHKSGISNKRALIIDPHSIWNANGPECVKNISRLIKNIQYNFKAKYDKEFEKSCRIRTREPRGRTSTVTPRAARAGPEG